MNYEEKALELRRDILRMLYGAQCGHPGGSLSCVELMMALYYRVANVDPHNPREENRDRIILSKGHACPTQYAILADMGFFPREDLWSLRQINSHLQGHPDMHKTPGIDASTGSLGQGVAVAGGIALAAKHQGKNYHVYAITGDGETQEGLVWEAAMSASHYKLDNLTVILDYNGLQIDGAVDSVMSLGDVADRYRSFGFACFDVDGHDMDAITTALEAPVTGQPKFICCRTIKGKGVSFMENRVGWHGKPIDARSYEAAMQELGVTV
ncbi:MAG: transketolase [Lawsonibacter sp.]|mgnify:CR=1 FL=1|nr:transketolase [Lawsonibacter sp.]